MVVAHTHPMEDKSSGIDNTQLGQSMASKTNDVNDERNDDDGAVWCDVVCSTRWQSNTTTTNYKPTDGSLG